MPSRKVLLDAAPDDAKAWFKAGAISSNAAKLQVEKLLTDSRMNYVWKKLKKLGFYDMLGSRQHSAFLLVDITEIYYQSNKKVLTTSKQRYKNVVQIVKDAKALADKIRENEVDVQADAPFLQSRKQFLENCGYTPTEAEITHQGIEIPYSGSMIKDGIKIELMMPWPFDYPLFSQVLEKFAEVTAIHNIESRNAATQPKSDKERNRLFCRRLSQYFKGRYSKPLNKVVAEIHNTLFDNCEYDEKAVGAMPPLKDR